MLFWLIAACVIVVYLWAGHVFLNTLRRLEDRASKGKYSGESIRSVISLEIYELCPGAFDRLGIVSFIMFWPLLFAYAFFWFMVLYPGVAACRTTAHWFENLAWFLRGCPKEE